MTLDIAYTAIAHATGGGRDGHVRSEDDRIDLDTRPPKELGAIHSIAKRLGVETSDSRVSAGVGIGGNGDGGFGLAVELDVYTPSFAPGRRQELVD